MKKIALVSWLALALIACSQSEQVSSPATENTAVEKVENTANVVAETASDVTNTVVETATDATQALTDNTKGATNVAVETVTETAHAVAENVSSVISGCSFDLKGTDAMSYTDASGKAVPEIIVSASCDNLTIHFEHVGKMPKAAMGHNVVIAKSDDVKAVAANGVKVGIKGGYLQEGDPKVVAASEMIGGGEKTSVIVPVATIKAGGYDFFCSFPGHELKMHGKLSVK